MFICFYTQVNPGTARCSTPEEHSLIISELRSKGVLQNFKCILSYILLEAANAEVQELSQRDDIPLEYLASALHKCGVFAQACEMFDQAEVIAVLIHLWSLKPTQP